MANVVTLASDTTDFTAAVSSLSFPGVYLKTLVDTKLAASAIADLYGTNGTYISSDGGDSTTLIDLGGSAATLAIADTTGILVGMFCYIDNVSAGTNARGYYEITGVTTNTLITISSDSALDGIAGIDANDTVSYFIGGVSRAFDDTSFLQALFDLIGPDTGATNGNAINNLDILCTSSTGLIITATIDIDGISGSATTRVRVIGTNSSFVDDGTQVTIDTATTLANGLLEFFSISDFTEWKNFDLDANSNAAYAVNNPTTETSSHVHCFIDCQFHGATLSGVRVRGTAWTFVNCDSYSNTDSGFFTPSAFETVFIGCSSHDNGDHGFFLQAQKCLVSGCSAYDNTLDGIFVDSNADDTRIHGCTCYSNSSDGMFIHAAADDCVVFNNTCVDNGAFGFNIGHPIEPLVFFGYNHANGNTTNPLFDGSSRDDAYFATFRGGNNLTGVPNFTAPDANPADFTPTAGSDLIDNGLQFFASAIARTMDIGAVQQAAGGAGGTFPQNIERHGD